MFTNLVFVILICQYNSIIASSTEKQEESRRLLTFQDLLIESYENVDAIANVAYYSLKPMMKDIIPENFFGRYFNRTSIVRVPLCMFCKITATYFLKHCRSQTGAAMLRTFSYFICSLLDHLLDNRMCRDLVDMHTDLFVYIGRNSKQLTAEKFCAILFQPYNCYEKHRPDWTIYIPLGYSIKGFINKEGNRTKPFKVLQITDPHMDSLYLPGADARCGKPLCCQKDQGRKLNGAGHWADYRKCDMPWHTMEDLLDQLVENNKNNTQDISYVYFTGDIISHRVWQTSIESNMREIRRMYSLLEQKFGTTPVFPIIGNHESHPLNTFAPLYIPKKLSTQWLYDLVAEEWSRWLPQSALATIRLGGYYTVLVRPGFRIIALNSNVCYTWNWWLLYENVDLYDQLEWLIQELLKAEKANEAVHILSHAPPGDEECLTAWSREFHKIVERFAYTITAQFNGHTHFNELKVFYNSTNISQPINVAYNGGSFTTYSDVNPNYRIYSIDSQTFRVTNYREWVFDVPIANFFPNKPPKWYPLYSFKHAYQLENLRLPALDYLVLRLAVDDRLSKKYHRLKVRNSETGITVGCDKQCMEDSVCSLVTTVFGDNRKCKQLKVYNYYN